MICLKVLIPGRSSNYLRESGIMHTGMGSILCWFGGCDCSWVSGMGFCVLWPGLSACGELGGKY